MTCRKILTPAAPFGPEVHYWYNRIHALKQMRKMLLNPKRKYNRSKNLRLASHTMENPKSYDLEKLQMQLDSADSSRLKQEIEQNPQE